MARDPSWTNDPKRMQRRAPNSPWSMEADARAAQYARQPERPGPQGVDPDFYTPDRTMGEAVSALGRNIEQRALRASKAPDNIMGGQAFAGKVAEQFDPRPAPAPAAPNPANIDAGPPVDPGRGKMTNAYGAPMAISNQNGVMTATDSAYDPLHYGVNAQGPMGKGYNEWAEANPYAAQQFGADTASGMQRREGRIAGENAAALQQAMLLQMPDLPARMMEAEAQLTEAQTKAGGGAGQEAVNANVKALDEMFKAATERFEKAGLKGDEAYSAAIEEVLKSAAGQGIDPLHYGPVKAEYENMRRMLQQGTDEQSWLDPMAWLPGSGVNAPWDNREVFQENDPVTGVPNELPALSSYNIGSDPFTHAMYEQEGSMWGAWPQAHGWALAPRALSDNNVVERRGPDGKMLRRGNIDRPDGMDESTFRERLRLLQAAEAARGR